MAYETSAGDATVLRRTLTTPKIVFLIVAAAGPMAAMVGTVPLAFVLGTGPGVPAAFVLAGLTLLCFSVGYAAMARHVVDTGGFYTYMARGLGRPPAVAGGLVAVISYNAAALGLVGAFGYFAALIGSSHGLTLPWQVWAAAGTLLMAVLGYRQIDVSARMLAVLMMGEVGILVLLDLAVVGHKGVAALPAVSFSPAHAFGAGLGVSLMFAFISFIGFESAAQYSEEARDPHRSVALATYISVLIIAVFYAATSWIAVGAVGPDRVVGVAGEQLGQFFFALSDGYLGSVATNVMGVLLCTSLFAAMLALHNAANRYLYVLGREGVLPGALGVVHPRHGSPARASLVQTALTVLVVGAFAVAGLDPYTNLSTSMVALGTLGIVVLQAAAAAAVIGFFRRHPDRHWWRTGLAPLLGMAGLIATAVLLLRNFGVVTGTDSPVVHALPWVLVAAVVAGLGYAAWLRAARPQRYAQLAGGHPAVDPGGVPSRSHVLHDQSR